MQQVCAGQRCHVRCCARDATAQRPQRISAALAAPSAAGGALRPAGPRRRQASSWQLSAYKVEIEHENGTSVLDVEEDQTVLEAALDVGLELSHDCKMGVCMTCPAKLESGRVDQSAGMLDDDVKEKGYALLCVSTPQSDCRIRIIEEDELLAQVLHGG